MPLSKGIRLVSAKAEITKRMKAKEMGNTNQKFNCCCCQTISVRVTFPAMGELKVGDPMSEGTEVGALVNEEAVTELSAQLAQSVALGARILCGGQKIPGPGCFYPPTVVTDTRPGMRLVDEEVFGPIAPIIIVNDAAEAVALANASEFGLGGSVWTRNLDRGVAVARRVESGTLFVNSFTKSDPRMPFGGVKNSGLGRELSHFGLREFTNIKGINVYGHG